MTSLGFERAESSQTSRWKAGTSHLVNWLADQWRIHLACRGWFPFLLATWLVIWVSRWVEAHGGEDVKVAAFCASMVLIATMQPFFFPQRSTADAGFPAWVTYAIRAAACLIWILLPGAFLMTLVSHADVRALWVIRAGLVLLWFGIFRTVFPRTRN